MRGTNLPILAGMVVFALANVFAQGTTGGQDEYKPYALASDPNGFQTRSAPLKSPAGFTTTYVLAYRGPQGMAQGLPGSAEKEFAFPSINFLFSAAAKLMTDDAQEPGRIDGKWTSNAELKKLNINVRIRALDGARKPLAAARKPSPSPSKEMEMRNRPDAEEEPWIVVLALSPGDSQFRMSESNVSKEMTSIDVFSRFLGPYAGVASGVTAVFKNWFRTKDTPTQVAYLSSDDEFGWSWRDAENYGIEGLHQCSAALRVRKEVSFLQVHVDMITDWRRFGAWMKSMDYVIQIAGGE
jgi:hypothetical protein